MEDAGTHSTGGAHAIDPVAVQLYDDNNAPALYIDDGSPTPALHLSLHNQSGRTLEFVDDATHHIELHFRPRVLSHSVKTLFGNGAGSVLSGAETAWSASLVAADDGAPISL